MQYIVEISRIVEVVNVNEEARNLIKRPEVSNVAVVNELPDTIIFVTVVASNMYPAQDLMRSIDFLCDIHIHQVLYSPQDHSAHTDDAPHQQSAAIS